jgi:hypothetical protein
VAAEVFSPLPLNAKLANGDAAAAAAAAATSSLELRPSSPRILVVLSRMTARVFVFQRKKNAFFLKGPFLFF